jgi:hypothetical protein
VEQQPIPIFKLKDPRPDICVGLSDDYLAKALEPSKGRSTARSFLYDLQDTSTVISDPHLTPLGLRFPFLIVEAKAGATGGNLYQAQNQAAVGGSRAVQIFETLSDLQYVLGIWPRNMREASRAVTYRSNIPPMSCYTWPFLSPLRGQSTNCGCILEDLVKKTSIWGAEGPGEQP